MKNCKFLSLALAASLAGTPLAATRAAIPNVNRQVIVQQDGDPSAAETDMFTQAQRFYESNQFDQAVKVLQGFLRNYPQSSITDLTLLWLARSYMGLNNLREAERVGGQLRQIKDTPFLYIYQTELADARRRIAESQPQSVTPAQQLAQNTEPPATRRPASPVQATPSPTPVARLIGGDRQTNLPPMTSSPTNAQPPRETTAAAGTRGRRSAGDRRSRRELTGKRQIIQVSPAGTTQTTTGAPTAVVNRPPNNAAPATPRSEPRRTPDAVTPIPAREEIARNPPDTTSQSISDPAFAQPGVTPTAEAASGGGFVVTVKQVPNLALNLRNSTLPASPGQSVSLPLAITNTGNKEDQFRVETDLPAEYQPTFSTGQGTANTGLAILVTPQVPRGGTYEVLLNMRIPETTADGQQRRFLVRAASQFNTQIERVADASLNIVAAALSANAVVSQPSVQPSEAFSQTIQVRNQGSSTARSARAEFVFDPDFELVSASPSPLVYDRESRTAVWSLGEMNAKDGREIKVNLRAVADALAASKPLGRGTLRTSSLPVPSNFDGPSVTVGRVTRAGIESVSAGLTATPGDTFFIPFVIRNPGNYAEGYELRITAPGAPPATIYADTNGDGQHQANEPPITQTAPVEARGGQYPVLLGVEIPRTTPDRQQYGYSIVARSLMNSRVASEGNTVLTVAAPRVRIRTEQPDSLSTAGDTIYYRLVLVNEGAGLARNLVVTEQLPAALQFANSDPALDPQDVAGDAQRLTWRVPVLAPGDTAVLRIAVKLRPNLDANTVLKTNPNLVFQDANGNTYRGQ